MEFDKFSIAVETDDENCVRTILATYPYYANKLLPNGKTPLHVALLRKNLGMMRVLIDHNADVNLWQEQNLSPLYVAILFFKCSFGQLLVESGANVNERVYYEYKNTPLLHVAVDLGKVSLVQTMIRYGADVTAKDDDNGTVLYKALQAHRPGYLIRDILERCDRRELRTVDGMYRNYLHPAINAGDEEVTGLLLAQPEIDAKIIHATGKTTLHFAALAERESVQIAKWMLERGVHINTIDRIFLNSALHLALQMEKPNMAKFLIENGAKINAINRKGYSPLYLAAKHCSVDVVELLIAKGANLHRQTSSGKTALHAACSKGSEDKIKILIMYGANLFSKDKYDRTAFQMIGNSSVKVAKLMIQRLAVIVTVENKTIDPKDWHTIVNNSHMQEYFNDCRMELEKMKKSTLYNWITMFYVIRASEEQLSKCMRNKEFVESFLSRYSKETFSIYADYVDFKLKRAEEIMKASCAVERHLLMIFKNYLTEYAVKLISQFIRVEDLPDCLQC